VSGRSWYSGSPVACSRSSIFPKDFSNFCFMSWFMQVLYFCSDSHWKNIMILPHFSPYGQSSKTKSGMELAKVAHVRQSLMWCSLSHSSGNSPHSPFLTDSTMALTSISRFWSTISSSWRTHEALPN